MTHESNQEKNKKETKNAVNETKVEQEKQKHSHKTKLSLKQATSSIGIFESIIFLIIFVIIACLLGYVIGGQSKKNAQDDYIAVGKELQTFIEQYNYILEHYYEDVDKDKLIQSAIEGMLTSLDDYSSFIDKDSNNFSITLEGSYKGVGIEISNNDKEEIVIRKVYANTSAAEVGLQPNDIILKFNDVDLHGKTSTELVELIKGVQKMNLTIQRGEETFTVELTKKEVILKSVYYEMLENKIGYIQLTIFANNTYDQFKQALQSLEQQGMQKLIIDVRNNGGGHLSTADHMLGLFMDSSHIMYQTDEKGKVEKFYSKGKESKTYPIVILQNGGSASASELLASSLKENLDAYIIGNKSYGKGTVQQLQPVTGLGQYKVTTKKWLTPNGNWIHEKGIEPDLEISLDIDYLQNPVRENDKQFQAALEYFNK